MRLTSHIHSRTWPLSLIVLVVALAGGGHANKEGYYGKYIGKLSQLHHGVSGDVFAVDSRTLHLRNFNYDGEGPAAYFYAGNTKTPGANGFRLRDERGTQNVLPKYRNKHITITLPEGKTLQNIKWFSVWCDEFSVNFGDVKIPKNLDYPKPQKIDGLSGVHGVSSEPIVIVDAQTLLVPSFSYDGEAPDAKFWVGAGSQPSPRGIRIPDENGKEVPLRRYDRKTIVLTLPGDLTIFDIGHFGVWCEAFTVDFGHVQIPRGLNVPPSLKMLGVSPQSKLNCEVLWDDFAYEVRWAVAGDSIVLQLVARLENNEYMSFGLSGDQSRSRMVGGDVVVAWVDKESLKGYAEDYYLDAKSQCSGGRGSCPDENIERETGSVRLLNAALVNGYSIVTFQRSLKAQDELDRNFLTNGSQPVIWAIGPLNSKKEVSYHSLTNRGDIFVDFGRAPKWNCPTPESVDDQPSSDNQPTSDVASVGLVQDSGKKESHYVQQSGLRETHQKTSIPTPAPAPKSQAWEIPEIKCHEPEDGVFYAQMGPTGGKHGYSAITGHVGWGISWYINGLLIPEINVVRGRTYTFIVEGGLDPNTPAKYHPFYITDDPVGGYQYKTPEERLNIQIFAGAVQNKRGEVRPTGIGRLCNWTPDPDQPPADEFSSFGAYQRTLRLECDPGNPGIIQWTVAKDTPDTVYYQCYTHRYLGWKIKVHDHCESQAGSDPVPSILEPPEDFQVNFEGAESINYEVRVKPENNEFFQKNRKHQTANSDQQDQQGSNSTSEANVNAKIWNDQFATFKDVYDETKQSEEQIVDILPRPVHTVSTSVANTAQPQRQFIKSSALPLKKTQESSQFLSKSNQMLGLSSSFASPGTTFKNYNSKTNFKNFQILPSNAEAYSLTNFRDYPSKKNNEKVKLFFQIPSTVEHMKNGENASRILRIQENGKLKKVSLKPEYRVKVVPKSPSGGPFAPRVTRKPSFIEASASHRRPHPFGIIKSPDPSSSIERQKFPSFTHVDPVAIPIYKYPFPFEMDGKPFKMHPERNVAAIAHHQRPQIARFAQNTGFDPNSVKIESGFKPILQTEKVSFDFDGVDRADARIEGEDDETVEKETNQKREKGIDKKEKEISESVLLKGLNSFTSRSPELFRPMFVPSFPDENFRKRQEKSQTNLVTKSPDFVGDQRSVRPADSEPSKDESKVDEGSDRKKRSPDDHDLRRHHDHDHHDHHDHRDHDVDRLNLGGAAVISCNAILLVGGFTFLSLARHHLII